MRLEELRDKGSTQVFETKDLYHRLYFAHSATSFRRFQDFQGRVC